MSGVTIIIPHRGPPIIKRWRTADTQDEPTASGVLFRAGDPKGAHRYLLLKRDQYEKNYGGHWAFPGGGIDPGETSLMGAVRECAEEIGVNLRPYANKLRSLGISGPYETWLLEVANEFKPRLNHEHTDYTWATHDELPSPMHPAALRTIQQLHQPY